MARRREHRLARPLTYVAALAAAGLLAATALAAPGDPRFVPRPADQAYARAILLHASELPGTGWKGRPTDSSSKNPACVVKRFSLSSTTEYGRVGRVYQRTPTPQGTFLVESDADVFANPAQAAKAFTTYTSSGYVRCVASDAAAGVPAGQLVKFDVRKVMLPGLGVVSRAFKVAFHATAGVRHHTLTLFGVSLRRGATVASLGLFKDGPGLPQAEIRRLASAIIKRMTRP